MNILNFLTIISYIALTTDIIFQIGKIYQNKSSEDLSLIGLSIRYASIIIILVKFISLSDLPLIVGQGMILTSFTIYLGLAVIYYLKK